MPSGEVAIKELRDKLVALDFDGAKRAAQEALDAGISPQRIVTEGIGEGMNIVGKKFEQSEYFLSELIVAGEVAKEVTQLLQPHLKGTQLKKLGKVVIGTVRGDLHDIGKNIVAMMLETAGFEVVDLGSDVPAESFVDAVKKHKPDIVGMSALLTVTMTEMANVIQQLRSAGVRDKVKVIVGGAPLTEDYAKTIGADAFGRDAVQGTEICKSWVAK
jgi:corrinoid protein of di/trimethylamine methyltransferase